MADPYRHSITVTGTARGAVSDTRRPVPDRATSRRRPNGCRARHRLHVREQNRRRSSPARRCTVDFTLCHHAATAQSDRRRRATVSRNAHGHRRDQHGPGRAAQGHPDVRSDEGAPGPRCRRRDRGVEQRARRGDERPHPRRPLADGEQRAALRRRRHSDLRRHPGLQSADDRVDRRPQGRRGDGDLRQSRRERRHPRHDEKGAARRRIHATYTRGHVLRRSERRCS